MNFVYLPGKLTPLSAVELLEIANNASPVRPFKINHFVGEGSRIQQLKCDCNGNGDFELVEQKENEYRRYVKCRNCGTVTGL